MKKISNLRNEIEWFKNNPEYTYLDSGATSLKPKSVVDAIVHYCNYVSTNPHNDDSMFAHKAHDIMDSTRTKLSKVLNADKKNIAFTPGATYSLNLVSKYLEPFFEKDDEIVLSNGEHASNLLPWYEIREKKQVKLVFADIDIYSDNIQNFLSKITKKTKLVAFANETNLLGNSIDANKLANEIKKINKDIWVSVDACQYLAHNTMDVSNSNIDFISCSAHKMLGPTGLGALYINNNLIEKVKPLVVGGGMNFEIAKNYYTLVSGVEKFEGGTPNILGLYGWDAALDYYLDPEIKENAQKIYDLKKYFDNELEKIDDFVVVNKNINAFNSIFYRKNVFSQDLSSYLGTQKIIVRSGLSCAKLANEVIKQDHVVRVSYHFYTNKNDIDRLLEILRKYKKGDELNGLL